MARFNLELLVGDELSKQELELRINDFINYMPPKKDGQMDMLAVLHDDIKAAKHWHMLGTIDGYPKKKISERLSSNQQWTAEKAHEWARQHFSENQLQELFTLAVNCAIMPYRLDGSPGYELGHSIIYDNIVKRKESMFHDSLDDKFIKRLNNGRFWENLYNLGAPIWSLAVPIENDVLENNYDALDLVYAKRGLEIFHRNTNFYPHFNIGDLSKKAIHNYSKFLNKLDEHLEDLDISVDEFYPLIEAYYNVLHDCDQDGNPIVNDYEKRLESPLIKKYERMIKKKKVA